MSQPVLESRRPSIGRLAGFALLLAAVSWGLGAFAAFPWAASDPGAALVRVAFKHVAALEHAGPLRSKEELEKLPRYMRPQNAERAMTGRRVPTVLRVEVDGRLVLDKRYSPGGFRHDGPTFGYEEIPLAPGRHQLEVTLADGVTTAAGKGKEEVHRDESHDRDHAPHGAAAPEAGARRQWRLERALEIPAGRALLIEFSEDTGLAIR